jgi:hypothetical protein
MGRVKVWLPAVDGADYTIADLPWANYVSPLAGQVVNYPAGSGSKPTEGFMSYGFWAIPKVGATVLVALLYGDVNRRFYMGSIFGDHGNRSLPVGRNRSDVSTTPVSDTMDPVQPQTSNLNTQFQGQVDSSIAKTRGAYERQVAQDKTIKDGSEGYQKGVLEAGLDPQTYCLATPGRHAIIMQDNPSNGRLRLKTADGHQIIFDDANERIYMSTAKGKSWIELDSDGHIHVFGAAGVSFSAGEDFNISALGNVNISGKNVNIAATGHARVSACEDVSLSGATVNITSGGEFNLLASGTMLQTASEIHLNGPSAAEAPCADAPSITPEHEPWDRPASKGARNSNWRA